LQAPRVISISSEPRWNLLHFPTIIDGSGSSKVSSIIRARYDGVKISSLLFFFIIYYYYSTYIFLLSLIKVSSSTRIRWLFADLHYCIVKRTSRHKPVIHYTHTPSLPSVLINVFYRKTLASSHLLSWRNEARNVFEKRFHFVSTS